MAIPTSPLQCLHANQTRTIQSIVLRCLLLAVVVPCRIVRLRLRIGRRGFVWELPGISHCLQVIGVGPRERRARISRLLWERIAGCPWILRLCTIGVHHNTFRDGDGLDPEYDLLFRGERV